MYTHAVAVPASTTVTGPPQGFTNEMGRVESSDYWFSLKLPKLYKAGVRSINCEHINYFPWRMSLVLENSCLSGANFWEGLLLGHLNLGNGVLMLYKEKNKK